MQANFSVLLIFIFYLPKNDIRSRRIGCGRRPGRLPATAARGAAAAHDGQPQEGAGGCVLGLCVGGGTRRRAIGAVSRGRVPGMEQREEERGEKREYRA